MLFMISLLLQVSFSVLQIEESSFVDVKHIQGDLKAKNVETLYYEGRFIQISTTTFQELHLTHNPLISTLLIQGRTNFIQNTFTNCVLHTKSFTSLSTSLTLSSSSLSLTSSLPITNSYLDHLYFNNSQYEISDEGHYVLYNCTFTGDTVNKSFYVSSISSFSLTRCLFTEIRQDGLVEGSSIYSCSNNFSITQVNFTNHYRQQGYRMCYFCFQTSNVISSLTNPIIFEECYFYNLFNEGSSGCSIFFHEPYSLTFDGCQFFNIHSEFEGGVFQIEGISSLLHEKNHHTILTIKNCNFQNISSKSSGGALNIKSFTKFNLEYCSFQNINLDERNGRGGILSIEKEVKTIFIHHNYFDAQNYRNLRGGIIYIENFNNSTDIVSITSIINNTFFDSIGLEENSTLLYVVSIEIIFETNSFYKHNNITHHISPKYLMYFDTNSSLTIHNCTFDNLYTKSFLSLPDHNPSSSQNSIVHFTKSSLLDETIFTIKDSSYYLQSHTSTFYTFTSAYSQLVIKNVAFTSCTFSTLFLSMPATTNAQALDIVNLSFTSCSFTTYMMSIIQTAVVVTMDNINLNNVEITGASNLKFLWVMSISGTGSLSLKNSYFNTRNMSTNHDSIISSTTPCPTYITNCTFYECHGNTASLGSIYRILSTGTVAITSRIESCKFIRCVGKNGLIGFNKNDITITIINCIFEECNVFDKMINFVSQNAFNFVENCIIKPLSGNGASGTGSAIFNSQSTSQNCLRNVTFQNIESASNGAIHFTAAATGSYINNCSFIHCRCQKYGGALYAASSTLSIINTIFDDCVGCGVTTYTTANYGGAIYGSLSTFTISGFTI